MPTLDAYVTQLAQEVGEYYSGVADSTSTVSSLVDGTNSGLAARIQSSIVSPQTWKDAYIFRRDAGGAGQPSFDGVRRVATYNPSAASFAPDLNWTTPIAAGEVYQLHAFLDPVGQATFYVNEALKRCFIDTEFTLAPTALNTRHNVTTGQSWLTDPRWVRQVGWLVTGETRDQTDPYQRVVRGEATQIGPSVYLNHPNRTFNTTDTIYVRAIKPAYFACDPYPSLPGTYSQAGLATFFDVALPPLAWVTAAALGEAWRRLGAILDAASNQRLIKDAAQAAAWFTVETQKNFALPPLTFRPLRWFGPLPGRY